MLIQITGFNKCNASLPTIPAHRMYRTRLGRYSTLVIIITVYTVVAAVDIQTYSSMYSTTLHVDHHGSPDWAERVCTRHKLALKSRKVLRIQHNFTSYKVQLAIPTCQNWLMDFVHKLIILALCTMCPPSLCFQNRRLHNPNHPPPTLAKQSTG